MTRDAPLRGLVVLANVGDTTEAFQDPATYAPHPTKLTQLGAAESHRLGARLHAAYLAPDAPAPLAGLTPGVTDSAHVRTRAAARDDAFAAALALLQGAFPPTPDNALLLANGTRVTAPLGGYQYLPVENVDPAYDRSLEPWTDCPNFRQHVAAVQASPAFRAREAAAAPFLARIQPFVPLDARLANIWNVHEYVRAELAHNQTFAYRLPPTLDAQARALAAAEHRHLFSAPDPGAIANVAGRAALRPLLGALERMAFDPATQTKIALETASYHPFAALLSLLQAADGRPDLAGVPDSASALVLELRRADAPGARDFVRVRFANGSAGAFETLHAFGHAGDIALTELLYRTRMYVIEDGRAWAAVCGRNRGRFEAVREGGVLQACAAALALVLGLGLFILARVRRRRERRVGRLRPGIEAKA